MRTRLEKHTVCADCFSVGITQLDCICSYSKNYEKVELEFEVCECCNKIIEDGNPADTEFNNKQLSNE